MKKVFSIFMIVFCMSLWAYQPYSLKCRECRSEYSMSHGGAIHNAWRDFSVPHVKKDGKIYALYRCAGGHKFLVELKES